MALPLQIQLLGGFRIQHGDELVTAISSPRQQSLFAYLLLHAQSPVARRQIAFHLWPDSNETQARSNLRRELHSLRKKLPMIEEFLQIDSRFVLLRSDAPYTLDVAEFCAALTAADDATNPDHVKKALTRAVACYQGPLFPDCYDEWIGVERNILEQNFVQALERLIHILEEGLNYVDAIKHAQLLLRHDPLSEPTYRTLMRLHALNGDRAGALRIYHSCMTMLERELDVPPQPETERLYRQLVKFSDQEDPAEDAPIKRVQHSSLVGRNTELTQLHSLWARTKDGHAHYVLISGEAGIGKSQLTEEFARWVSRQGGVVAKMRSYEVEAGLAYSPVIELLRGELLKPVVAQMQDVWLVELARLLPELLIERADLPRPQPMTDSRQQQRLFESLTRALQGIGEPLLLILDDTHWCDEETASWLRYLFSVWTNAPLLLTATVRPEEMTEAHGVNALWRELRVRQCFSEIVLPRMSEIESFALANQIAGYPVDSATAAKLYTETEGVPLFLVEMMRAGRLNLNPNRAETLLPDNEYHPGEGDYFALPAQIQAVIEGRLSRLSASARRMAALAAAIGRAFDHKLLVHACDEAEGALVEALDELWQRHIIREQGAFSYVFSHDKIREVAYGQITPMRRRQLHDRIAHALEIIHASNLDAVSGQLARHYDRAGMVEQALQSYERAAAAAQRIYANQKALDFLNRALVLLETLPDTAERAKQELALLTKLSVSQITLDGYGAPRVRKTHGRIQMLCTQLRCSLSPLLLRAMAIVSLVQLELERASQLGAELLRSAQEERDHIARVEAHYVLGVVTFWRGQFTLARAHFEQVIALYQPPQHHIHIALYGQDPKAVCLNRLAWVLWYLGYAGQAIQTNQDALALAYALSHPLSLSYIHATSAQIYIDRRDWQAAAEHASIAVALSSEHRLGWWRTISTIFEGGVLAERGDATEGLAQIKRGIAEFRTTNQDLHLPYALSLLARTYIELGTFEGALMALNEALHISETRGLHFHEAEIYGLQGELLLASGAREDEAESCFRQALEISRRQGAKMLELRSATRLARLWQQQGRTSAAYQLLAEIYNWFTEGFDTADLQDASALLSQLR